MTPSLLAIGMPGPFEMMLIMGVGLLFFGKRLPEVGKGMARGIVEFKKGLKEVTDEIDTAGNAPTPPRPSVSPMTPMSTVSPTAPVRPPAEVRGL